jgi:hypothetical protein
MLRTSRWLAFTVTLACVVSVASGYAVAQTSTEPADTFSVNYYSNATPGSTTAADQKVRAINPGSLAPSYPPQNLCAMIYVFDNRQEMKECCGCLITPDGLLELSVNTNLTNNPFTAFPPGPANGDIKIVSALENDFNFGGSVPCDPAGGGLLQNGTYANNIVPIPDLRAWSTHLQTDGNTTEDEFQDATLSSGELDSLQEECFGIANTGSGVGICARGVATSSEACN